MLHRPAKEPAREPAKEDVIIVRCPACAFPAPVSPLPAKRWTACANRVALTALLFLLAGCGTAKPNFLEVIQRNCQQGSDEACEMLAAVSPAVANEDTDIAPPVHSRDIVQAILAGMRRARQNYARHDQLAPATPVDPDED